MTPTGRVLSMEGDSHLPFLLGNVSLLPFETFPKGDQKQWVVDSGVSISEENESSRGSFGPRGPFGPFAERENKSVQAASEVTRYNVEGTKGNLVSIRKSYQLTSPGSDEESFDMSGAGVWVFDNEECVPHSLDLSAKLIAREGNSSTTYPITIKYTRVTAAELAKMEAEAKRVAEETQRKAAEAKALAEAPLTAEEKQNALAGLTGSDTDRMLTTLKMLEGKSPLNPDPEIVSQLTRLMEHKDKQVSDEARKALVKWSPEFKRKHDLNKAYQGPGPVASSDLEVESSTPLAEGQIIQYQEHGSFWYAGRVKRLLPNNKVLVEALAWGKPNREVTLARRNLQLAPPEVDQPDITPSQDLVRDTSNKPNTNTTGRSPNTPASSPTGAAGIVMNSPPRTWTDKSGRFSIEATFVSEENGVVKLLRKDGKQANIPLDKLSDADQAFIRQMLDENPFEVK